MKKAIIMAAAFMTVCLQTKAQTIATAYKGTSDGNPISGSVFCADPTAIEYEGRLYVYGTNDHQQYIVNNKTGSNGYGNIKSLVVFSTDDMVNWTFHGTIDVGKVCTWAGQSWAPSAVWREKADGTKEFYVYFANGGGSVGVMRSTKSPLGPFTSPLTQAMIRHGMAGVDPCNWLFDPGVVIDSTGTGWIAFGGGDPQDGNNKLMPGNSRIAKLKPSMTSLDGAAVNLPAPYLFEASELNIMNGRFVYTYNTSWSDRNQWNSYEKRNGQSAPSSCSMCYMVTDNPLDPDSWEYRGEYVPNEGSFGNLGADWGNNHTHLQKFNGNYYLFYHGNVLEKSMKNKGGMDSGASGYRSLCVNRLTVDEETQTLNKANMTKAGPTILKNMNPYELQQAETMATSGGVNYEDFKNIKTVSARSSLGNDASENLYIKMAAGKWTQVRKLNFGTNGPDSVMLRLRGTGKMEIRLGTSASSVVGTVEASSTTYNDYYVALDHTKLKGVKNICFVCTEGTDLRFDAWKFTEYDPTGIETVSTKETNAKKVVYDLSGRRLQKGSKHRGLVIEQYTDENGTQKVRKHL